MSNRVLPIRLVCALLQIAKGILITAETLAGLLFLWVVGLGRNTPTSLGARLTEFIGIRLWLTKKLTTSTIILMHLWRVNIGLKMELTKDIDKK